MDLVGVFDLADVRFFYLGSHVDPSFWGGYQRDPWGTLSRAFNCFVSLKLSRLVKAGKKKKGSASVQFAFMYLPKVLVHNWLPHVRLLILSRGVAASLVRG